MGLVAGIPFPDIYDWTWGEIVEYINCRNEAERNRLRDDASMYFRTASLIARMIAGQKGQQYKVVDEYGFLWTDEEKKEMKRQELHDKLMKKSRRGGQ